MHCSLQQGSFGGRNVPLRSLLRVSALSALHFTSALLFTLLLDLSPFYGYGCSGYNRAHTHTRPSHTDAHTCFPAHKHVHMRTHTHSSLTDSHTHTHTHSSLTDSLVKRRGSRLFRARAELMECSVPWRPLCVSTIADERVWYIAGQNGISYHRALLVRECTHTHTLVLADADLKVCVCVNYQLYSFNKSFFLNE